MGRRHDPHQAGLLRAKRLPIGSVAIDAIADRQWRHHAALKSLARQTGGHVFAADHSAAGIAAVYKQIGAET